MRFALTDCGRIGRVHAASIAGTAVTLHSGRAVAVDLAPVAGAR